MSNTETLRHFLAALAYRFQTAVRDAPAGFGTFEAGSGVRGPAFIVRHMSHVLKYAHSRFAADADVEEPSEFDFDQEVGRFHDLLAVLDQDLCGTSIPSDDTLFRLLQGPFADVMTHVGQLAMLRRMAGSPVPGQNFFKANVQRGRVGVDQG